LIIRFPPFLLPTSTLCAKTFAFMMIWDHFAGPLSPNQPPIPHYVCHWTSPTWRFSPSSLLSPLLSTYPPYGCT
jgi:hypothetical protein